jgi:hypothetical protein
MLAITNAMFSTTGERRCLSFAPGFDARKNLRMNIISHTNEVYGTMTIYLRLKGIVPPLSEGR